MKRLFDEKIVSKDNVGKILAYCKRTIFGHLQLYLACISMKKQERRIKRVELFTEVP